MFLYIPFAKEMILISFMAPTVEPLDPPMSINTIIMNNVKGGHPPITVELSMLAPVVVMAETTTNRASMETMFDVKCINSVAMAIKEINTLNCKS